MAGLFPPYAAKPPTVDGAASDLENVATNLSNTGGNVCATGGRVTANVSGTLTAVSTKPSDAAARDFGATSAAAMVAAGAMTLWSRAIEAYNTGVEGLNRRWREAKANDFGVSAADYGEAETRAERDAVDDDRSAEIASERTALLQELKSDEHALMNVLDGSAKSIAGKLKEGPTEKVVLSLFLAGALPATAFTVFPNIELTDRQLRTMKQALQRHGLLDSYFGIQQQCGLMSSKELGRILDQARAMGLDPTQYRDLLQRYYVTKAAEKAGINLCAWDPSRGADALRDIVESVYTYYGQLYLNNPNFKWAGMANMIGPSFAAGFFDLNMLRDLADGLGGPIDDLPDEVRDNLPFPLNELGKLSDLTQEDIAYYEETFLQMQKDIFFDMAASHEAYLEGGMEAIEEMEDAGLFDQEAVSGQTVQSWGQVDEGIRTGNSDLVDLGNTGLLYREQHDIIDAAYKDMYDHDPTGPIVTYMMGVVGNPSIPDAQALGEVYPLEFDVPINVPGPFPGQIGEVEVETPFPDGNLTDFDTRWGMIQEDTLPAYLDLVNNDPGEARDLIGSDVHERIEDNRLTERIPDIIKRHSDWDVEWNWF